MTPDPMLALRRAGKRATTTDWRRRVSLMTGWITVALGGAVLLGWHTHTVGLIQVHESLVPMQYNTALGFVLCGASILSLAAGRARRTSLATVLASLAVTIGLLTLFEYGFQVQLGLDQLFMEHHITVNTPYPGRMAPTAAVSFTIVGGGLIGLSRSKRASRGPLVARVIAAVVVTLAMTTLVAYAVELRPPFGWTDLNFTLMAVHTAAGFLFLCAGLFMQTLSGGMTARPDEPIWLRYVVGAVGLSIAILSWQNLISRESARIEQVIAAETNSLRSTIDAQIKLRTNALLRMSRRWEFAGGTPRDEWEADAARYATHQSDVAAFTWIDASLQARWSVSGDEATEVESADTLRLVLKDDHRVLLNDVRDRGQHVIVTEVVDLGPEGVVLNFYMPLFPGGEFDGFLLGSYRLERLVKQIDALLGVRDLEFVVFEGDRELFGRFDDDRTHDEAWGQEVLLSLQHVSWRLRAWPSLDHFPDLTTRLPELVASGLVFIALLLSFTVGFAEDARRRGLSAEKLSQRLERDMAAQSQMEHDLQESEVRFRSVADSAVDATILADAHGIITYWNKAATAKFGHAEEDVVGQPLTNLFPEENRDAHRARYAGYISEFAPGELRERLDAVGLKHDGTTFSVELSLTSWESSGDITIAVVVRDMTEANTAEAVLQQTIEQLADSNAELNHFNKLAVGREIRMIELKREINRILEDAGKPAAYDVSFASTEADVAEPS